LEVSPRVASCHLRAGRRAIAGTMYCRSPALLPPSSLPCQGEVSRGVAVSPFGRRLVSQKGLSEAGHVRRAMTVRTPSMGLSMTTYCSPIVPLARVLYLQRDDTVPHRTKPAAPPVRYDSSARSISDAFSSASAPRRLAVTAFPPTPRSTHTTTAYMSAS